MSGTKGLSVSKSLIAKIDWAENTTPASKIFDDVYYSKHGGLEETRLNFLEACGLPDGWQDTPYFCIAELGFGTGLNFLASVAAWMAAPRREDGLLDFISFEKYPLTREDAEKALTSFEALRPYLPTLLSRWPIAMAGTQAIYFPHWRARLILHIGDIIDTLPETNFKADAWFLDGFSPAKNPSMWDETLYPLIAERSASGARLGTFTVAGHVRRGLERAGFQTEKVAGYGRKRHRLRAHFAGDGNASKPKRAPKKIAILGAGIVGASLAARLSPFAHITLFETTSTYPNRASANPLALVIPRLDVGNTPEARACREAYASACHSLVGRKGARYVRAHQAPRDEKQRLKFDKLRALKPLPATHLEFDEAGLIFPYGLLISPEKLAAELIGDTHIRFEATPPKLDVDKRTVNSEAYDSIILAMGPHLGTYIHNPPIGLKAGQVDWAAAPDGDSLFALNNGHYALGDGDIRLWGSSFEAIGHMGEVPNPKKETSALLMQNAERLLSPEWLRGVTESQARVSVRATTPTHLPIVGAVPRHLLTNSNQISAPSQADYSGFYVAGGMGSRGFGFASYIAEILASQIMGWTSPIVPSIAEIIDIDR